MVVRVQNKLEAVKNLEEAETVNYKNKTGV